MQAFTGQRRGLTSRSVFTEVFDASPIPVWIYNFPGVNSVDLDSDMINELAEHPNCGGVKLTCANLAKGYRIALHTKSDAYKARHPSPFLLFAGFSDYLTGAMISRHDGAITGTGAVSSTSGASLIALRSQRLSPPDTRAV
jgi:dihydrodipicolinate synthase/N-acetylneuraminate lyase